MNCLCCGKPLDVNTEYGENRWHDKCVKSFFGVSDFPDLDLSKAGLKKITKTVAEHGVTVPGVQKKLSLSLGPSEDIKKNRLTIVDYPSGYILKPQTEEYSNLPEAEHLVMSMARDAGITTVPFGLIDIGIKDLEIKKEGKIEYAYITKRVDRVPGESDGKRNKTIDRIELESLAMEDFCQLDGRLTEDKYKGSYERCAKIINTYSSRSGLDMAEFFLRIVFSFIIGNSDMHLKNFSLIETSVASGEYVLSPAYDLLPVNIILPEDKDETALTLNGKKRNIKRSDFIKFGSSIGLNQKSTERLIENAIKQREKYLSLCEDSYLPNQMKENLSELIVDRIDRLQ